MFQDSTSTLCHLQGRAQHTEFRCCKDIYLTVRLCPDADSKCEELQLFGGGGTWAPENLEIQESGFGLIKYKDKTTFPHTFKDPLADPALPPQALALDTVSDPSAPQQAWVCLKDTHSTQLWGSKLFPGTATVNVSFRFTSNCIA